MRTIQDHPIVLDEAAPQNEDWVNGVIARIDVLHSKRLVGFKVYILFGISCITLILEAHDL